MTTTLVSTRKPNALFQSAVHKSQHGRFGTLVVLKGAVVTKVSIGPATSAGPGAIMVPTGVLQLATVNGGTMVEAGHYTTIERM